MATQKFKVGVFPHQGKKRVRYMAYTRDYNPQWKGCCEHEVEAVNGTRAKFLAIMAHQDEQARIAKGIARPEDRKEVVEEVPETKPPTEKLSADWAKEFRFTDDRDKALAQTKARIKAAEQMVYDLCNGKRRWIMSVPAQPESDPDLVIAMALRESEAAISALEAELQATRGTPQPTLQQAIAVIENLSAEWEKLGDYGINQGYVHRIKAANEIITRLEALAALATGPQGEKQ